MYYYFTMAVLADNDDDYAEQSITFEMDSNEEAEKFVQKHFIEVVAEGLYGATLSNNVTGEEVAVWTEYL